MTFTTKGLHQSFNEAEDVVKKIESSPKSDEKLNNLATSLVHDLERAVMRLPSPDDRDKWRSKLETLNHRLHDASGEPSVSPAPATQQTEEVVGDIDDLFSGMNISESKEASKPAFVPQAIPGRRFMRVVRSPNGTHATGVAPAAPLGGGTARSPLPISLPDGHDAAGQGKEDQRLEDADEEHQRYKPHAAAGSSPPLRVVLPDLPPEVAAAAAAAGGAASHGSADSTMARGGNNDNGSSDSDDESITSPENPDEASSFR